MTALTLLLRAAPGTHLDLQSHHKGTLHRGGWTEGPRSASLGAHSLRFLARYPGTCPTVLGMAARIWGGSGLSQSTGRAAAVTGRMERGQSRVGTGPQQVQGLQPETLLSASLPCVTFKGK